MDCERETFEASGYSPSNETETSECNDLPELNDESLETEGSNDCLEYDSPKLVDESLETEGSNDYLEHNSPDEENLDAEGPNDYSEHSCLYKNSGRSKKSQQERREEHLRLQKMRRQNLVDKQRDLSPSIDLIEPVVVNSKRAKRTKAEAMNRHHKAHIKRRGIRYKLMLTEWFREVPSDFPHNWVAKFCPEGHRNLIIATKHNTRVYGRGGQLNFSFQSALPGGGGGEVCSMNDNFTVLDTIYVESTKTFFVLDMLAWNGIPMINCEAECRFFLLKSRLEELPPLKRAVKVTYNFEHIESLEADPFLIQEKLNHIPIIGDEEKTYDGVVFYHKESDYVFGETPLALWMKIFMIPEILPVELPPEYLPTIPRNYVNMHLYLKQKDEDRRQKLKMKRDARNAKKRFVKMDQLRTQFSMDVTIFDG